MKQYLRIFLSTILTLTIFNAAAAQVSLSSGSASAAVDFETALPGVASGPFEGAGFNQVPGTGQLDSDAWQVLGFSDGDLLFGGSAVTGDLARGTSSGGGTSTGGLFALGDFPASGGRAMMLQPGGSDVTPGSVTLRILNGDTADTIREITVSYDIYERNDAGRSSSLNFSYSTDNTNFTPVPALDHASLETGDKSPGFVKVGGPGPSRTTTIPNLSVPPNGGEIFLRWDTDDLSGSGSRDELAIDNIAVTAVFLGPTAANGVISGSVRDEAGNPVILAQISLTGPGGSPARYVRSNVFGSFEFSDVPLGETYVLEIFSGRYAFADPVRIVNASKAVTGVEFTGVLVGARR